MPNCLFCYKDAGSAEHHVSCCKKFFGIGTMPVLELNDQIIKELAETTISRHIAITGVQPKLSVTLEKAATNHRLTIVGLWGQYILKPQHHEIKEMPQIEDLTMHLAEYFGINTCGHCLMKSSGGGLVYIAKRFDRINNSKIHMEDFCQLSDLLTENKYKGSYERMGKLILQHCTNAGFDALRYFELLLFCYLTGNNDMHLKNFSVLYRPGGIDFSPAYDLLNVNIINPKDQEDMALMLNGRKKKIKLRDFDALAMVLGIPPKVVGNTYKKFQQGNAGVQELIDSSFLSQQMKTDYAKVWATKQDIFNVIK